MKRPHGQRANRRHDLDRRCFKHPPFDIALQVEEAHQRIRFCDSEVIAGENAQLPTPVQEVTKVLEHSIHAAFEREAHDDVRPVGARELRNDVREERVVAACDQIALGLRMSTEFG